MGIVYVFLAMIVIAVSSFVGGSMYGARNCKADREQRNAEVKVAKAKDDAKSARQSDKRDAERAKDDAFTAPLQQEIENDVRANPAPADCVSPPGRLSRLNALIDEANAPRRLHQGGSAAQAPGDRNEGRGGPVDRGHGTEVHGAAKELPMPGVVGDQPK
jgi:hypothetical protein